MPDCSIGIAHYPDEGRDLSALLKAADVSLYAAQEEERRKTRYALYDSVFTHRAEYRFQVEQHLREAIEKQQLSLFYQPQVGIETAKIVDVEALLRWSHPVLGQVSPEYFIATAERTDMIKPLIHWALSTACSLAVNWKKSGPPDLRMAVNLAPGHFMHIDIVEVVQRVLDQSGMKSNGLVLEVTESLVQTGQKNLSVFQDLKELGVLLAIDDFGMGYSSFASLKHLKADYLKIDKHFIADVTNDKRPGF
ncbi:MAG: EAL domain-containing protein (putative c-di-GMP-specific phosphodiesterase class I) [Gammaproteobacteria bacterium]|jgi:EAL domain-containing protein (putative c-di-GMP-specific phosphodiesterase class I)